jgi:aspartyl-tRNA(Asn)/glutamyl-tRNA(Gln) amidotransferase subunit A
MELCDYPAHEIVSRLKKGEFTACNVLESAFKRIEQVDGRPGTLDAGEITDEDRQKVHAFLNVTRERALAQARSVDESLSAGADPGPLAGVPFSVKDIFTVKGTLTTAGSRILSNFTAPYTATIVDRMEKAGAVMIGKVNMDEFAFGSSNETSAFQPASRNPWDTSRTTGGSSGGSVASVSSGEAAASVGTDTAGSIRQPAAFTGLVGLKPTYGRVSRYGLISAASSLDCSGIMTRTAHDAALILQTVAGQDPHDATTSTRPVPNYLAGLRQDVRGLRVGLSPDYFNITYPDTKTGRYEQQPIPEEIKRAVLQAAEELAKLGVEIVENVPLPNTKYGIPSYFVVSRVEKASNLHRFDGVKYGYRTKQPVESLEELYKKTRGEGFGWQPKLRIMMGMYVSAAQYSAQYYQRALRVRTLIRRDFGQAFDPRGAYRLDALLTPTTPTTAFKLGEFFSDTVMMQYADQLTVPANHAGIPGLSFPGGLDAERLPIGLQLLGDDFREGTLLQLAHAYENATAGAAWRKEKPAVLRMGS